MNTKRTRFIGITLVICLWALGSTPAMAKTWYVEKWGIDLVNCGSRSLPCGTINEVLSEAGKNDRIIVGPGTYSGSKQIGTPELAGLKLYSSTGRYGTTLLNANVLPILTVTQPNVRIGARGKGFTFLAAGSTTQSISSSTGSADRVRIEGNHFDGGNHGVFIAGEKVQIRDNTFAGIASRSISCNGCTRGLIRGNLITNAPTPSTYWDAGIYLHASDKIVVTENRFRDNESKGILSTTSTRSATIKDNGFYNQTMVAVLIENADGFSVSGNIQMFTQSNGMEIIQSSFDRSPATIRGNISVDAFGTGIELDDTAQAKVEYNTSVDDYDFAIEMVSSLVPAKISRNNAYDTESNCAIHNDSGVNVTYQNQFVQGIALVTCGGSTISGTIATKPSPLKARRAAKL